jgi:hypothetical protein
MVELNTNLEAYGILHYQREMVEVSMEELLESEMFNVTYCCNC